MLRIIALKNFSDVKKGQLGGLIEKEGNLSQKGDCWVYDDARVSGNAYVCDNVKVYGKANVSGFAGICGNAQVYEDAWVCMGAKIYGNVYVAGEACVADNAEIPGNVKLYSTKRSWVTTSIKDSKDYVIFVIKKDFYIISLSNNTEEDTSIGEEDYYIKNIQIIRQLYGKEI